SMAGVDIRKGDIAVIDCARTAKHGDVILADVDGLLTIRIWEEGLLVSINTARVEHHISEYANVRMIGVVLTIFRRLFK
ncbi:MAG: S24 family peptidase, partial [Bacteroidota bacterium]